MATSRSFSLLSLLCLSSYSLGCCFVSNLHFPREIGQPRAAANGVCRRTCFSSPTALAGGFGNNLGKQSKGSSKGGKSAKPPKQDKAQVAKPSPSMEYAMKEASKIVDNLNEDEDPFWQLIEPLILSEFPRSEMERVIGFIEYSTNKRSLPPSIVDDKWRPHEEIHAFMDGIPASPFRDTSAFPFIAELEANYEKIKAEFEALLEKESDRFQSVTSMNYKSGWKTLVLYYNGHGIDGFPYHLCPVTKSILDKVPVAGRIAGFNRQSPQSGIPLHSDGNNMWLTCQMGIKVPAGQKAWIRVGPETRRWAPGKCLLYDTTFEHETFNESPDEERVVLHVDFWNFADLTPMEVRAMQRIYQLREMYLQAEGLLEVGGKL